MKEEVGSPEAANSPDQPQPDAPTRRSPLAPFYREFKKRFPAVGFWIGVFAAFYFWVTVTIDAWLNRSWWQFTGSSFSALGDPGPVSTGAAAGLYWIYNDVVVFPTAIMIMVVSAALTMYSRNRIQSTGSSFFMVSGVFLFLVGVYHGGPPTPAGYHDFVSDWFFIQSLLALLIWGVGLLFERRFALGGMMLILAFAAVGLLVVLDNAYHISVAENEALGIIAIDLWLVLLFFARNPVAKA